VAERLSRRQLYDLVWSEPLRTLSIRFGISDVALKKTCQRASIPSPERGYWARKEAGKKTLVPRLPERLPAMEDEVLLGGGPQYGYRRWTREELLSPTPPPPEFNASLEAVRKHIAKIIGSVAVSRNVRVWHPAIQSLLKEDEARREEQHAFSSSGDKHFFDSPLERRRLRLLNSLFTSIGKFNGTALPEKDARKASLSFYNQHLILSLAPSKEVPRRNGTAPNKNGENRLILSILESWGSDKEMRAWQDDDHSKLERKMTEIAVEVVLLAEVRYREAVVRQYHWRIERKAEFEEEDRRRLIEAERTNRERLKRLEEARVNHLLSDAAAFQQASAIREYVAKIQRAQSLSLTVSTEELQRWIEWALAQADRIDPSIGDAFVMGMRAEQN
jgi:hypothetical protein